MAEQAGQTASRIIEQTRRAAAGLPRPVRNNPWPLALIGVGVAWFLMNSARDGADDDWRRDDEAGDEFGGNYRRQHEYSEYSEYQGRATKPALATAADVATRVGDMASEVSRRARDLSRSTQNRLGQTMRDSPMAVGAVALAAGALIGTLMPCTEVEDT